METIMKHNSDHRITKILAEVRGACDVDAEILEEILLRELDEYCRMLQQYCHKEYGNAISRARDSGYVEGHTDGYTEGYDAGYDAGYSDGYSDRHS